MRKYARAAAHRFERWLISVGILATPEEDIIYGAADEYLDGLISQAELHRRLNSVSKDPDEATATWTGHTH